MKLLPLTHKKIMLIMAAAFLLTTALSLATVFRTVERYDPSIASDDQIVTTTYTYGLFAPIYTTKQASCFCGEQPVHTTFSQSGIMTNLGVAAAVGLAAGLLALVVRSVMPAGSRIRNG
ncbi:hypothetical protein JNJ66_01300 [Candidatus Saccharibacteria bacterium]|nr:hypothetical protein [Candidatus Saccharibacteria bacterium]